MQQNKEVKVLISKHFLGNFAESISLKNCTTLSRK